MFVKHAASCDCSAKRSCLRAVARPGAGRDDNFPWGKSDTALVTATYVIGYILCICYAALFFIMFALRKATKKFKTGQAEAPLSSPSSAHGHSYRHSGRQGYSQGHGALCNCHLRWQAIFALFPN